MLNAIHPSIRATQNIHGDHHINLEEMEQALRKSNNNKAPGPDGIASAFYVENWETVKEDLRDVLNRTIEQETTEMYQNQGIIVCLPKSNNKNTPEGYRPITLLNTDYKFLARILAQRIRPTMEKLRESQFCGVPGNNIFDAVTTISKAIAQAELSATPLCVISIDFKEAFEKIAHKYLFAVLEKFEISKSIITGIKNLYAKATSKIQINGYISEPIPIQSSIRQGCPMSMQLYALFASTAHATQ